MLTLTFNKPRSPQHPKAVKLALEFDKSITDKVTFVELSIKEIFEKWDIFNELFWTVVDWKGTILTYDGMNYQYHTDKKRIYYDLKN